MADLLWGMIRLPEGVRDQQLTKQRSSAAPQQPSVSQVACKAKTAGCTPSVS